MFSDYVDELRETLSSDFFFSANGKTWLTKTSLAYLLTLFFLYFTNVRITWATRLFSLTKTASRWGWHYLSSLEWLHIPWKPNLKWIQSAQSRLLSLNRPNRRSKWPSTCIVALFLFLTLNHTASHQRAWAHRSDLNVSHCKLGTTGPCVWAGCADGCLFRSSSGRWTARLMQMMMMIHTFLIFKAPLFSSFLGAIEICVETHKRFKPNPSPSLFPFPINDFYTVHTKKHVYSKWWCHTLIMNSWLSPDEALFCWWMETLPRSWLLVLVHSQALSGFQQGGVEAGTTPSIHFWWLALKIKVPFASWTEENLLFCRCRELVSTGVEGWNSCFMLPFFSWLKHTLHLLISNLPPTIFNVYCGFQTWNRNKGACLRVFGCVWGVCFCLLRK